MYSEHVLNRAEDRQRLFRNFQSEAVEHLIEAELNRRRDRTIGRHDARDRVRHASQAELAEELLLFGYDLLPIRCSVEAAACGLRLSLCNDYGVAFLFDYDRLERGLSACGGGSECFDRVAASQSPALWQTRE
jgi:hypothetical protein